MNTSRLALLLLLTPAAFAAAPITPSAATSAGPPKTAAAPAHPVPGGWISDPNGCQIWNAFPHPEERVTWSGPCIADHAQGIGTLEFYKADVLEDHYVGSLLHGKRSGQGALDYPDGQHYEGHFSDGYLNGHGLMTRKDGFHYEGGFLNGLFHGAGVATWADGSDYDGAWFNGMRQFTDQNGCHVWDLTESGAERLTWSGGCLNGFADGQGIAERYQGDDLKAHYEGTMARGKRQGHGSSDDGRGHYEGDWVAGGREGHGVLSGKNGSHYEGDFLHDLYQGNGVLVWLGGGRYQGSFVAGHYHGHGSWVSANGSYDGEWINDYRNGKGTAVYAPSNDPNAICSYTGEFAGGQRSGAGVAMYCVQANGRLEGTFLLGKPYNATWYTGPGGALPPNTTWATYANGVQQLTGAAQTLIAQAQARQAQAAALAQAQAEEQMRQQQEMEEEEEQQAEQEEAERNAELQAQRDQENATALAGLLGSMQQASQPRAVYTRPAPATAPRPTYVAAATVPLPQVVQATPATTVATTVASAIVSSNTPTTHVGEPANGCVKLDNSQVYTGGISTESAGVINTCGYRVSYTYCIKSGNGGGVFSCQNGAGNLDFIAAYGRSAISIMGSSSPFEVKIEVCRDPATPSNGLAGGRSVSCVQY